MPEGAYQTRLIKKLRKMFPGCIVLKNDSGYMQGIPDLTVFYRDKWAMLEVKVSATAEVQPNQQYYVELMDELSFAAFIYPDNEEEVLRELEQSFKSARASRIPQPQR